MIGVIDYGLGNVTAITNIYRRLGIDVAAVSDPAELAHARAIILPGVGAFDHAMRRLEASGMKEVLNEAVLVRKVPVLGICVGMQMMANSSSEGSLPGLGWIPGAVRKFERRTTDIPLPHMGWNDVRLVRESAVFRDLEDEPRFYFLHSYYYSPADGADVLGVTDYYGAYASTIHAANVFGVQFHPEKSHGWGIQLLKNFAEL